MVKRTITISSILLIIAIIIGIILSVSKGSFAADDIASGTTGTCSWVIDSEGVLTISPTDGVEGMLESYTEINDSSKPWNEYKETVTKVVVNEGVKANTGCSGLFFGLSSCTSMDLAHFDTSNATTMRHMFSKCSNLISLDLKSFDTSNVTDMYGMFNGCSELKTLDLTSFDTRNVKNMGTMFFDCSKLTSLNLLNFDTRNVTTMYTMFYNCYKLESIDLSSFDTSKVNNMSSMFYNCNAATSIDVSSFNTSNVNDMHQMFTYCFALADLDVSRFNTEKVTSMASMFDNCRKITTINVSSFDTSQVTTMSFMFCGCFELTNLDLSNFNTSKVTNMNYMFASCDKLETLNVSSFDTSNVNYFQYMFLNTNKLTILDISNFDTKSATHMLGMFKPSNYIDVGSIREIKLGPDFSFKGNNITKISEQAIFPQVPTTNSNYGKWIREDGEYGPYSPEELRDNYDGTTMAGKWIWYRDSDIKYSVSYSYIGDVPEGASQLPQGESHLPGIEVKIADDATAPGYIFSGWSTGDFIMPENDVTITGYFIKEENAHRYKIDYYFDGIIDPSLEEMFNANEDEEISITPQSKLIHEGKNYTLVSSNHKITVSINDEDNVIEVYYESDVLDYEFITPEGDGIPDKYQISITFKIENGSWDDGTNGTKTSIITLYDKDGNLSEQGTGETSVPSAGNKPSNGYTKGSWNKMIPSKITSKDNGKEYIYSYEKISKAYITEYEGKVANPITGDKVQRYISYGTIGMVVLIAVIRIRRKYSRKKKKIQF